MEKVESNVVSISLVRKIRLSRSDWSVVYFPKAILGRKIPWTALNYQVFEENSLLDELQVINQFERNAVGLKGRKPSKLLSRSATVSK